MGDDSLFPNDHFKSECTAINAENFKPVLLLQLQRVTCCKLLAMRGSIAKIERI